MRGGERQSCIVSRLSDPFKVPPIPLPFFHESIGDDEVPPGITSMPTHRPDMIITVKLRRRRKKRRRRRESFLPRYMEGSSCLPGLTRANKKKNGERGFGREIIMVPQPAASAVPLG